MFGLFRAGGFAAASLVLSTSVMGVGHSQVLPLTTAVPTLPAQPAAFSPVFEASPQIVLPVESAPTTPIVQPTPEIAHEPIPEITPAPVVLSPIAEKPVERATLAQLVTQHRSSATASRELECLAGAIYFESKGEPLPGQVAVGQVVANRAKSGRFPGSYCGVVFQRSQFSFVRGRALPPIPRASAHWKTAVAVAHIVDNELHAAVAPKALFFHARYVSPGWKRMSRVATVGNHVFYR